MSGDWWRLTYRLGLAIAVVLVGVLIVSAVTP